MDGDSDTERETLLPKDDKSKLDEDLSDKYPKIRRKYASSSSDYDEDDDDNFDEDDEDEEGDELLGNDHAVISSSTEEDKDPLIAPVAERTTVEDSFLNIRAISNESLFNETLESPKEIDIMSDCQLGDDIIVNKPSIEITTDNENEEQLPHNEQDDGAKFIDESVKQITTQYAKHDCFLEADFDTKVLDLTDCQLGDNITFGEPSHEVIDAVTNISSKTSVFVANELEPQSCIEYNEEDDGPCISTKDIHESIEELAIDCTKQKVEVTDSSNITNDSDFNESSGTSIIKDERIEQPHIVQAKDDDGCLAYPDTVESEQKQPLIPYVQNDEELKAVHSKSDKVLIDFTSNDSTERDANKDDDLKEQSGSTKDLYEFISAESTESDQQLFTNNDDKIKGQSESTKDLYEFTSAESTESDQQLLANNDDKLKGQSGSTKDLYEFISAESTESDQQLLANDDNKIKDQSGSAKDLYEFISAESTESDQLLLANNDDKIKVQTGSTKDLYEFISAESTESDQRLLANNDDKIKDESGSNTDLYEFISGESTESDQLLLANNVDKIIKDQSGSTKDLYEFISAESIESDQQLLANNDDNIKDQSGSNKDLYEFVSAESTESDQLLLANNDDKIKDQTGSTKDLHEFIGAESTDSDQPLFSNKSKAHSGSTNDIFGLITTETAEDEEQLLRKQHTKQIAEIKTDSESNECEASKVIQTETVADKMVELKLKDKLLCESPKGSVDLYYSANDIHEYDMSRQQEFNTPDLESGFFEKTDSLHSKDEEPSSGQHHLQYDQTISESLHNQLNRFDLLIETMDQRNTRNMATNAAERGYWSTIFGQASEIEAYDEMSADRKAHRALELLEDYHSRLSEPQDRALRIAIERVIRIFKSRLFQALLARDFMQAYKHQSHCIQSVVKMLQQLKEENWCLPVMYTACLDLRILAQRCEELGNSSKPGEILEKAADCLMSCFRVCAADNRSSDNETKRLGMLHLVNQLFKVYFRINKLHLCKPLIRAIDSSAFKDMFPLPERITYKYFVGRKAMFDSDYKSADEFLSFAFKHCPKNFPRNKRLILIYLVPVKMLLGFLPKKYILERYDVLQFHELAEALKEGNVRKFDDVIQRHEIFFIKCGIYLLVEKLKFIVYRNLFKKVYIIKQTHQLDLNAFSSALQFVGETDMTIDETHCIVANLIFEGKIKGYISHSHNKLVVSKQNPFPPLNTVS